LPTHSEPWGDVVEANASRELASIADRDVVDRIARRGAVMFRGFELSNDAFAAFADRFSRRTVPALHAGLNRERVGGDEHTVTVDMGSGLVGYHLEMGYSPSKPELLWFYCVEPAARGGETIVCDGAAMLAKMDPSLAATFRARRIKYVFRGADAAHWGLFAGEPLDYQQALERLAKLPGVRCAPSREAGRLDLEYVTSAIVRSRLAGVEAFASSITIFDHERVRFEDDAPIDRGLRLELAGAAAECAGDVPWRAGDVLVVDNSRVMHGRQPFHGARRILVRMTDAR
jgi:alpha-ketoglutarate-dependent taurine dioxygenase